MGRLAIFGNPFDNPFTFVNYKLTGANGTDVTQALSASGGSSPYTYAIPQSSKFSLSGSTLICNADDDGTFATLAYAKDGAEDIATAYVEVTVS